MSILLGVDPGLDGGFALIDGAHLLDYFAVPTIKGKNKGRQIDEDLMEQRFRELCVYGPEHAFIESVHAMPQQGSASMFKFGECFGLQKGLIRGMRIPRTLVPPAQWKLELGLGQNKEVSLERAAQLFPDHVTAFRAQKGVQTKDQAIGVAEAALIAYFGRLKLGDWK